MLQIQKNNPAFDKIYKIREFSDALRKSWKENFNLGRDICIDEMMIRFKGRSDFIQYMPMKPIKRGFNCCGLADCKTNYIYDIDVYTGSKKDLRSEVETSAEGKIVQHFLNELGHVVYMDNFFSFQLSF